jgi:hypothetical protein
MEEEKSDSKLNFSMSLSLDRDHFLRRSCPSCGREFKTEIDKADLAWAVAPQIQRIGLEIGVSARTPKENPQPESVLCCPYCEHSAPASEMLSEETVSYLRRQMIREVVLPMMRDAFSGLEDIGGGTGGFISVRFEHHPSVYPPRPLHGPELPDMKIIEFLCCGKRAKVADGWNAVAKCVYCDASVRLV